MEIPVSGIRKMDYCSGCEAWAWAFFTCTCKDTHKPVLRKTRRKSWLECGGKTSDFEEPSEENRSIHFKTIFDNYLFEKNWMMKKVVIKRYVELSMKTETLCWTLFQFLFQSSNGGASVRKRRITRSLFVRNRRKTPNFVSPWQKKPLPPPPSPLPREISR